MAEFIENDENIVKTDPLDVDTTFVTISQLFNKNRRYRIPNYQRGYAWQDKHINALWKDIFTIYEEEKKLKSKKKNNDNEENSKTNNEETSTNVHYMGVLAIDEQNKSRTNTQTQIFDIVDGQQRITTIIFLLKALIENLEDKNKAQNLTNKYISAGNDIYKFDYNKDSGDREFFHYYIYKTSSIAKDIDNLYKRNIYNGFNNLKRKVDNLSQNEVTSIIDIIENNLVFNIYKNTRGLDAKKTFESMNNRGKELTKLELLKNRLIYLSTKIEENDFELVEQLTSMIDTAWGKIYHELGKNLNSGVLKDDEFLKAHWVGYRKHFREEKGTLENIKAKGDSYAYEILDKVFVDSIYNEELDKVVVKPVTYQKIKDYVNSLSTCAELWSKLKNPNPDNTDDEELVLLDRLSRIRNFLYVDALILATLYKHKDINLDKRLNLYRVLEKYIFINYGFKPIRSTNDMSFCNSYTQDIFIYDSNNVKEGENDPNKIIDDLVEMLVSNHDYAIKKTLNINKENNLFETINKFVSQNYYSNMNLKRYFLYEYNKRYIDKENYDSKLFDWAAFKKSESIEHILPQSNISQARGDKEKRSNLAMSWQSVIKLNDEKVTDIKDNSKLKTIFQDENELIKITNSLGNLVAIVSGAKNSHLSNKSYAIKLKQYKIGTAREQEIAGKHKYWTIKEIYDRTNSMLDFIYKQWFIGYISEEDFNSQKDKMINWTYDDTLNPHSTLADLLDDLYKKELELHKEEKQRQEEEEEIKNSLFEFIVQNKQHPIIDELKDSAACKKLFNKKAVVLKEIELDKIKGEFKNKQKSDYRDYCLNLDKKIEINNHYYVLLDDWKDKIDVLKDLLKTLNQ